MGRYLGKAPRRRAGGYLGAASRNGVVTTLESDIGGSGPVVIPRLGFWGSIPWEGPLPGIPGSEGGFNSPNWNPCNSPCTEQTITTVVGTSEETCGSNNNGTRTCHNMSTVRSWVRTGVSAGCPPCPPPSETIWRTCGECEEPTFEYSPYDFLFDEWWNANV